MFQVLDLLLMKRFLRGLWVSSYVVALFHVISKFATYYFKGAEEASVLIFLEFLSWSAVKVFFDTNFLLLMLFALFQLRSYLHSENRINVVLSYGVSPRRLLAPLAIVVGVVCFINLQARDVFVPHSLKNADYVYYVDFIKKRKKSDYNLQLSDFWYKNGSEFIHIGTYNFDRKQAHDVTIYDLDEEQWKISGVLNAKKALVLDKAWDLKKVVTQVQNFKLSNQSFPSKEHVFEEQLSFEKSSLEPFRFMASFEKKLFIEQRKKLNLSTKPYEYDHLNQLTVPLSIFFICLIYSLFIFIPQSRYSFKIKGLGFLLMLLFIVSDFILGTLFRVFYLNSSWSYSYLLSWGPTALWFGFLLYCFKRVGVFKSKQVLAR